MDFELPNVGGISNLSSACKRKMEKTPNETSAEEQRGETPQNFPLPFFQLGLEKPKPLQALRIIGLPTRLRANRGSWQLQLGSRNSCFRNALRCSNVV